MLTIAPKIMGYRDTSKSITVNHHLQSWMVQSISEASLNFWNHWNHPLLGCESSFILAEMWKPTLKSGFRKPEIQLQRDVDRMAQVIIHVFHGLYIWFLHGLYGFYMVFRWCLSGFIWFLDGVVICFLDLSHMVFHPDVSRDCNWPSLRALHQGRAPLSSSNVATSRCPWKMTTERCGHDMRCSYGS